MVATYRDNSNSREQNWQATTQRKCEDDLPPDVSVSQTPDPDTVKTSPPARVVRVDDVGTDYDAADSDDDGLTDSRELTLTGALDGEALASHEDFLAGLRAGDNESWEPVIENAGFDLLANPTREHSDDDQLNDSEELRETQINVTRTDAQVGSGEPERWSEEPDDQPLTVTSEATVADTDGDGLTDGTEVLDTHTHPRLGQTYAITTRHEQRLEALYNTNSVLVNRIAWADAMNAPGMDSDAVGIDQQTGEWEVDLTDRTDDFDFVFDDQASEPVDRFLFTLLSGNTGTDTWLNTSEELAEETAPWDPDTDDDGLTDGQETHGITYYRNRQLDEDIIVVDGESISAAQLDPTDPDTDDDGFWDGWIGVYGVGRSDNVILYREHLEGGIQGADERVDEQVGIHRVDGTNNVRSAEIFNNDTNYHSNIHVGELHWDTDPTTESPDLRGRTTLHVEVDWMEGHNPFQRQFGGQSMLATIEDNFALYGLDVVFHRGGDGDDPLTDEDVTDVCKVRGGLQGGCLERVTLPGLNALELGEIEGEYHDNNDRLHLLFATEYQNDFPPLYPYDPGIDSDETGLAGHTGSPEQIAAVGGIVPYGAVVFDGRIGSTQNVAGTTMHEIGHGLGIGYADDKDGLYECYSEQTCVEQSIADVVSLGGGEDSAVETVDLSPNSPGGIDTIWSIMTETGDENTLNGFNDNRMAFSMEELLTIDFEEIPAAND